MNSHHRANEDIKIYIYTYIMVIYTCAFMVRQ